jgi:predicted hydrocarbon binding protein
MALEFRIDVEHGAAYLAGAPLVFHCHYYNCALQRAIESGLGIAAPALLRDAATDAAVAQLGELGQLSGGGDAKATLTEASAVFAKLGFGVVELGDLGPTGGKAIVRGSHYALGWLAVYGERDTAACHFAVGFVTAAMRAAYGVEKVEARETKCVACGAAHCEITVEVSP